MWTIFVRMVWNLCCKMLNSVRMVRRKPPHLLGLRSSSGKPRRGRMGSDFDWRGVRACRLGVVYGRGR